jgi:hypothetical protein
MVAVPIHSVVARRPAESTSLAGALSLIVVRSVGVTDPDVIVAIGIVIGAIPTLVTSLVEIVRGHRARGSQGDDGGG